MPRWLTGIAVLAAIVLLGASATMNWLFVNSLGRTQTEGMVLGAVSVSVDVLKAVLAVALGYAARERRYGFVAVASFAFALFTALSLTTAVGFTASNRGYVTGERERQNSKLTSIEAHIGELRSRLKALPAHRPLTFIDEALAVARSDPRWSASRQCSAPAPSLREFCQEAGKLRPERAAALEAGRLEELLTAREAEAERLRGAGSGQSSDPQAMALARALGFFDEAQVQRLLMLLLGLAVEIGSGVGVYLALGHGLGAQQGKMPKSETKREPVSELPEPKPEPASVVELGVVAVPSVDPLPAVQSPEPVVDAPRPGIAVSVRTPPARPVRRNGIKA